MRTTLLLIAFVAALMSAACSRDASLVSSADAATLPRDVQDLAKPPAPKVTTTVAAPAEDAPIAATGELISPMRSQVAPKQPGRVAAVFVREGARVRAGEPLALFETDYLKLELQRAEAELARAEAMESDAARDLERKRDLVATESVSRAAFDHAQSACESSVAARKSAAAVVATIRQRITDATLRAPFDGVVEARSVNVGERLGDAPAFVIAQTTPLKLRFRLPEHYLGEVREGQKVTATTDAWGDASFEGRITMLGGVIDPATRTLLAEADIDNSTGRLQPGMFARVTIAR